MSSGHFIIYTNRLEKAGIYSLWVSLGSDKDRNRLMHVSPDASVPREIAAQYPTRTFLIDGTDPVLQALQDDMAYSDDGVTPEKVMAAIEAHPYLRADLNEWLADWLLLAPPSDEEIASEEVSAEDAERSMRYVKGLLRGVEIARAQEIKKAPGQ